MQPAASFEPPIVRTLRRYWQRGASERLLVRLAGGRRDWRLLNEWWNIDGSVLRPQAPVPDAPAPVLDAAVLSLGTAERRIALVQIADDYAEARRPFPTGETLARHFGCAVHQIHHDLDVLREQGLVAWRLVSDGTTGLRRQPVRAA